jgi:hypothetical protein
VKANGRHLQDLQGHLWTFSEDGPVTRMQHLVNSHRFAPAAA